MYLECTCAQISAEKWAELMKGGKPINYKWLVGKVKKELPELYNSLALEYPNPFKDECLVTKTHYILVHSAIEYFIKK